MSDAPNQDTPAKSDSPSAPVVGEPVKTLGDIVREVAPEALEKIPDDEKALLVIKETRHIRSIRSAPLPEPSELAAYNAIIPNAADRIMKMAESQTAHRIEIEKLVIGSQKNQAFRGQLFGLFIAFSGLALATFAAINGHDWFGGTIGSGTLVSLVYVFVQTREKQTEDLSEKKQQMQQTQPNQGKKKKNRNK